VDSSDFGVFHKVVGRSNDPHHSLQTVEAMETEIAPGIGITAAALILPLERITTLVTDTQADANFLMAILILGVKIILAERG
jgi:hypothetical protein